MSEDLFADIAARYDDTLGHHGTPEVIAVIVDVLSDLALRERWAD